MSESVEFESLVARFYAPLYQFAFSLARVEADACDLTQQTFTIWATKGHQLRDVSKVKTWLFTTLHREFLDSRRRQTRFPHFELESAEAELPSISPMAISHIDTAHVLGVPLGTVKSRLARGIAQLQHLLARDIAAGQHPSNP